MLPQCSAIDFILTRLRGFPLIGAIRAALLGQDLGARGRLRQQYLLSIRKRLAGAEPGEYVLEIAAAAWLERWYRNLRWMRKLYYWVLSWAFTPYAVPVLFGLAFAESSFFPVPPDVLLIALAISVPAKAFYYAAICSVGSVLGGMVGYLIGYGLMDVIGYRIVDFYGFTDKWNVVGDLYNRYAAWAVGIAGFTPIPYKVFTIAGGAFKIDFLVFVLASAVSRSARFFIVAALIYKFGAPVRAFIDKYFDILAIVFVVLLVGGFVLVKYVIR